MNHNLEKKRIWNSRDFLECQASSKYIPEKVEIGLQKIFVTLQRAMELCSLGAIEPFPLGAIEIVKASVRCQLGLSINRAN